MLKSEACEYPKNELVSQEEVEHPLYMEYLNYKRSMEQQLVYCVSFNVWLNWKQI